MPVPWVTLLTYSNRNVNICSSKCMHKDDQSNMLHSSSKLESAELINCEVVIQCATRQQWSKPSTATCDNTDECDYEPKRPDIRVNKLYDSVYNKFKSRQDYLWWQNNSGYFVGVGEAMGVFPKCWSVLCALFLHSYRGFMSDSLCISSHCTDVACTFSWLYFMFIILFSIS